MTPTQTTTRAGVVQLAAAKLEQIDRATKRLRTMWNDHAELMKELDGDDFAEYRRRTADVDVAVQADALTDGGGLVMPPEPLDVRGGDADPDFAGFWDKGDDDSGVLSWLREHLHIAS